MERITSFTVSHLSLRPGVCVSRKGAVSPEMITIFGLRMTAPDKELIMNTAEIHTLKHLGATFLWNHTDFGTHILCFGPMGCRVGSYLLLRGDYEPADILPLLRELFRFVTNFMGEVPGVAARDCDSYLDINLPMAKWEARRYLERALNTPQSSQLRYPD